MYYLLYSLLFIVNTLTHSALLYCYRIYLFELPPEFTAQNTIRIRYTNYCIKIPQKVPQQVPQKISQKIPQKVPQTSTTKSTTKKYHKEILHKSTTKKYHKSTTKKYHNNVPHKYYKITKNNTTKMYHKKYQKNLLKKVPQKYYKYYQKITNFLWQFLSFVVYLWGLMASKTPQIYYKITTKNYHNKVGV